MVCSLSAWALDTYAHRWFYARSVASFAFRARRTFAAWRCFSGASAGPKIPSAWQTANYSHVIMCRGKTC